MDRGYVRLWRKTLDSGLLQHPTAWQVFGYLLMTATSKPHKRIIAGVMTEAKPGEVITGRERLAEKLGLSVQQVRTALNLLKKLEIITITSTNKYSVISLVNWDAYQQERPAGQPAVPPAGQPAPNQRLTTEQELKNINITPSLSSLRSERVSPKGGDSEVGAGRKFYPPTVAEVRAYCDAMGYGVNPQSFVDFYESKGWKVGKAPMKDWRAAVRTWEAKRKEAPRPEPGRMNKAEAREAHNRAVCQEVYDLFTGKPEQGVFDI